jgi:hypothetical protein
MNKKEEKERKPRSAQGNALRAKNWKEYTATVEDIERFLSDHVLLRNNVVTGRSLRSVMAQKTSSPTPAPDVNTDTDDTVIF